MELTEEEIKVVVVRIIEAGKKENPVQQISRLTAENAALRERVNQLEDMLEEMFVLPVTTYRISVFSDRVAASAAIPDLS